jgi:hypothetical protein
LNGKLACVSVHNFPRIGTWKPLGITIDDQTLCNKGESSNNDVKSRIFGVVDLDLKLRGNVANKSERSLDEIERHSQNTASNKGIYVFARRRVFKGVDVYLFWMQ